MPDPLAVEPAASTFDLWWPHAQARAIRLQQALKATKGSRGNRNWKRSEIIQRELQELGLRARDDLVRRAVQRWQTDSGTGSWRLPPDGWISKELSRTHPEWRLPFRLHRNTERPLDMAAFALNESDGFDYIARRALEASDPTRAPFRPITERRVDSRVALEALTAQERRNADLFRRHARIVQAQKRNSTADVAQLFKDCAADLLLPDDLVVYHQVGARSGKSRPDLLANMAFAAYLSLLRGDLVRFDHMISATTKTWWFGTLGNPGWPHINDGKLEENALRLELHPQRGLYLGEAAAHAAGGTAGRGEQELLIPPGGVWEVVGIRDVVQQGGSRSNPMVTKDRLRAVQLKEISDPADREVRSLTFTLPS